MVDINDFISKIEGEFEEMEPGKLKPETSFLQIKDWSSMHALIIIALIDCEYGVTIKGEDLRTAKTILDLFNIISERIK